MKSRHCAQCNVSSARFGWGFALLARDGWAISVAPEPEGSAAESDWLCPACRRHVEGARLDLAKPNAAKASFLERVQRRGKLRVLLIDDEEMVWRCTARLLGDFEVVSASSARAALELLKNDGDFDAVLSDVMMPGMSGPELYALCYRNFPHLAQRFVFASGNPEAARVQLKRAVASVAAEHPPLLLAKPCSRDALVLAIFAAAAQTAPRSGTYSAVDPAGVEVTKYRG